MLPSQLGGTQWFYRKKSRVKDVCVAILWVKRGKHPVIFIASPSELPSKFENSFLSVCGETSGTSTPLASPPALWPGCQVSLGRQALAEQCWQVQALWTKALGKEMSGLKDQNAALPSTLCFCCHGGKPDGGDFPQKEALLVLRGFIGVPSAGPMGNSNGLGAATPSSQDGAPESQRSSVMQSCPERLSSMTHTIAVTALTPAGQFFS